MYRTVYYHKTTRSAEVMLKMLFQRYNELLSEFDSNDDARFSVVPDVPPAVCRAFSSEIALEDFLMLDAHTMTEFAKACSRSSDAIMTRLASGVLDRRLYKGMDVSSANLHAVADFQECAKKIVAEQFGEPDEYLLGVDSPSDTAYKPYNPDAETPATQIYISNPSGKQVELSQCSDNVKNLTKKYTMTRYYFPEAVREEILEKAAPCLIKE